MTEVLRVENVTKRFGGLVAVDHFVGYARQGELLGLIGPNGAGKTTLFNVITGMYAPDEGRIVFLGKDISGHKPYEITRTGIARTFQNIRLFSDMTVLENVMVSQHLKLRNWLWLFRSIAKTPGSIRMEKQMHKEAIKLLERVGLETFASEKASSLPYGLQRKLEIARALATNPKLLLLDEPAAGMNPQETYELMGFIKKVRDDFSLTIMVIEHDMKVIMGICERIYVMDYGKLIAEGNPRQIQSNPAVIKAYLGEEVLL
ncbi:ABC transporter ATP-binding protein [Pseudothermotoga sp. U03pept]|uniref:ABC transporter ATP-binding protein n=1 Tax=Pseudothermotoga sp. U03pept TaxID=3447012 RepID=UPI003F106EEA